MLAQTSRRTDAEVLGGPRETLVQSGTRRPADIAGRFQSVVEDHQYDITHPPLPLLNALLQSD